MADTNRNLWFAWVRDSAFVAAIVAGVAGAWVIANALGDLEAQLARVAVEVEHQEALIGRNAKAIDRIFEAIDRNTRAIDRNAESIDRIFEAIDRNAKAIDRNAEAIGELKESVAGLAGRYAEHTREHQQRPAVKGVEADGVRRFTLGQMTTKEK